MTKELTTLACLALAIALAAMLALLHL